MLIEYHITVIIIIINAFKILSNFFTCKEHFRMRKYMQKVFIKIQELIYNLMK